MSYNVEYKSETVRIKLMYDEGARLLKIKVDMNRGFVQRDELYQGLKFLNKQGLGISKEHAQRKSYEEIIKYVGQVTEVNMSEHVTITIGDDTNYDRVTVTHVGLIDQEFIDEGGINLIVDVVVAFYGYYKD